MAAEANAGALGDVVEVLVTDLAGNLLTSLQLPAESDVVDIKQQVFANCGIPLGQQRYMQDSAILSDTTTLRELGLPPSLTLLQLGWKGEGGVRYRVGEQVQLHYDGNVVFESLAEITAENVKQEWLDLMNDMLGRTFTVMTVPAEDVVGLPHPSGSEDVVFFPVSVVRQGETFRRGDVVRMNPNEQAVLISFNTCGYVWHHLMRGMLGKEFPILEETRPGIIALPSPDGSQNGLWYFPVSVVSKVTGDEEEEVVRYVAN
eukprot:TRINITY_DN51582_c0_g1_i1.p1 TRINITY_DN51582_c0_g1~~TRINITY_DN51582_c0_g1_i1.p1  ORF type:complete len:279 (-),score=36.59 TRINITY_DN51582_c0_g1_i1:225-1004(-)